MEKLKVLLLAAAPKQWQAQERIYEKDIISSPHSWVFAFDGNYCPTYEATPEIINQYDIVIGNTDANLIERLLELQDKRNKNVKWVTLIERCATDYMAPGLRIKALLDGSDLVNVINLHSLDFFREITTSHCEYIGMPYPADGVRKIRERKHDEGFYKRGIFLQPLIYNPEGLPECDLSYYAAKRVAEELDAVYIHSMLPEVNIIDTDRSERIGKRIFHKELYLRNYLQLLADAAYCSIGLDHRYTWGRHVMDCAALEIPCISTSSAWQGDVFFPLLMVLDEFSIQSAQEKLFMLYKDEEFYKQNSKVSLDLFESFSHESMRNKLLSYL